jgi:hypothetical protein
MKKENIKTISIDGVDYVRASEASKPRNGMNYVIVRSRDSGCHAGYIQSREGDSVVLVYSRRLYYWSGASTLSQLAMEGVKKPESCKFPCEVSQIEILGVCEIIPATEAARINISEVPVWQQ